MAKKGSPSPQIRKRIQLYVEQNGLCYYCKKSCELKAKVAHDQFTIEHVTPRCLGGTFALSNLIGACYACNQRRSLAMQEELKKGRKWNGFTAA
jgi:5-methylcytosine-specific restriction endonuclease McrA